MEKILRRLIEYGLRGVDTYTHNGSTWLIFTDNKQWVIELTENKTLWYNYNFFTQLFCVATNDVVENQKHITKWVEDNIINKVKHTVTANNHIFDRVKDAIQNGVKKTKGAKMKTDWSVEDTLENGVKHTYIGGGVREVSVEDAIQNGVKETQFNSYENKSWVEGVIKGGVKETNHVDVMKFFDNKMEDALQNGVKETKQKKNVYLILDTSGRELILESHLVVRDGVKETSHRQFLKTYDVKDTIQDGTEHDRWILDGCDDPVDVVLDNGVKITAPLQSREYTGDIDEVLENGVKETHEDVYHHKGRIDGVIKNGVKETKTPGNGDLVSYVEWMKENNSNSYPKMIDDVIEYGTKNPSV